MKLLTARAQIALNALQYLYAVRQVVPSDDIAGVLQASVGEVKRVMQRLSKAGLVRGEACGYRFMPGIENRSLSAVLKVCSRGYVPSALLNREAASERAGKRLQLALTDTCLKDLFEGEEYETHSNH